MRLPAPLKSVRNDSPTNGGKTRLGWVDHKARKKVSFGGFSKVLKSAEDVLTFTANYVTTFSYLGVGFILIAAAWFVRHKPVEKAILGGSGLALILTFAVFAIIIEYWPDALFSRASIVGLVEYLDP